jgi:hypothetical protein
MRHGLTPLVVLVLDTATHRAKVKDRADYEYVLQMLP